jgi:hypothetical protein
VVGFIKGLFGSKPSQDSSVQLPNSASVQPDTYFLGADEAQSLGNVDYMRATKTVRRTFPKTVDSPEEKELIVKVSATTKQEAGKNGLIVPAESNGAMPKTEAAAQERRRADTSMDMFRNMAKNIRQP